MNAGLLDGHLERQQKLWAAAETTELKALTVLSETLKNVGVSDFETAPLFSLKQLVESMFCYGSILPEATLNPSEVLKGFSYVTGVSLPVIITTTPI